MENNNPKNFKLELSFEQISIITDLAMAEKCREEEKSNKALYENDKTDILDEIVNIITEALFL